MSSSLYIHFTDGVSSKARSRRPRVEEDEYTYSDRPLAVSFDIIRQLVEHSHKLKDITATLRQAPHGTRLDSPKAQAELFHAENSAEELSDFLNACWERIPIRQRASAQSAIQALKVFGTPELLEHIPLFLKPQDTLSAQQVSRVWRDGVNGSVKIQRRLGLCFDEKSNFTSIFSSKFASDVSDDGSSDGFKSPFKGLEVVPSLENFNARRAQRDGVIENTLDVCIYVDTRTALTIGDRCGRMSICQPPLKRVKFDSPRGCDCRKGSTKMIPTFQVASEKGLVVKDIVRAAEEVIDLSEMILDHSTSGSCHGTIRFRGTVALKDDDPIMLERRRFVENVEEYLSRELSESEDAYD